MLGDSKFTMPSASCQLGKDTPLQHRPTRGTSVYTRVNPSPHTTGAEPQRCLHRTRTTGRKGRGEEPHSRGAGAGPLPGCGSGGCPGGYPGGCPVVDPTAPGPPHPRPPKPRGFTAAGRAVPALLTTACCRGSAAAQSTRRRSHWDPEKPRGDPRPRCSIAPGPPTAAPTAPAPRAAAQPPASCELRGSRPSRRR